MEKRITHAGIKGQKWGVRRYQNNDGSWTPLGLRRRASMDSGSVKRKVDSYSSIVNNAKTINDGVGKLASRVSTKTTRGLSEEAKILSDADLRAKINRLNMEQQYVNLNSSSMSKGKSYVTTTLEVAGTALAVTSSALGIALAIKALKGG